MQPSATRHHAPILCFLVRAGRQGRIKGQRWRGKPRDCLSPRAGHEQRELAWWRGKPRDCLSQRVGEARKGVTPLRSTTPFRPSPALWGQAPFVHTRPLGGALLSGPACRPSFVPRGTPNTPPAVPRGTFTNVNHCICNHYKCKLQM